AAYDAAHDDYVVSGGDRFTFGGKNGSWALNLGTLAWSTLVAPGGAPIECGQSALFDPGAVRIVAFGGAVSGQSESNATVASNLVGPPAWTTLDPLGSLPSARSGPSIALDP